MIFKEFNPKKDDCHKIAKLIYSVDQKTFLKVFKSKNNAISAIENLLLAGKEDFVPSADVLKDGSIDSKINSSYSTDSNNNEFYLILNEDSHENSYENDFKDDYENNREIIGIIQIVKGKRTSSLSDILTVFKSLKISDAFKFSFIHLLDYFVLAETNEDDLYIAEIAIDEDYRGKGLGTKVLLHVIKKAKEKKFKRVVLDVDLDNKGAIKLYKSLKFRIFNKKTFKFINKKRQMYNMEYVFDY